MLFFWKRDTSYKKTLKFLCNNCNKKSTRNGLIITNQEIRMDIGDTSFDSFGHMSYRHTDNSIMFKNSDELDESNYYCIILPDGTIFVNTNIIKEDSKFIVKDEFDDPIEYKFDTDLYYESLVQVAKISFKII